MKKLNSFTLRELLISSAESFSSHTALQDINGRGITYSGLGRLALRVAEKLFKAGYPKGARIALLSENRPEWGIAYLGITASGYTVAPILTDFQPEQIRNILEHSESRAVFVSKQLLSKISGLNHSNIEVLPIEEIWQNSEDPQVDNSNPLDLDKFLPPVGEEELAALIYTSGTTGNSKGVMLSHRNITWNAWATRGVIRLSPRDKLLSILPLAHTYECTIGFIAPLLQGCSITYLDRPPSATVLVPALKKIRPTVMLSVPLLIEKIVRAKVLPELNSISLYKYKVSRRLLNLIAGIKLKKQLGGRLRFFGIGGAALSSDVEAFLKAARFPYAIGYGLTETAPLLAGGAPYRFSLRSTGPALKGVELRIAGSDPVTGEGEIQARGPNIMIGYYREEEKTRETFTEDGWFKTGDLGVMNSRGELSIRGRLKTMILGPAGENIYPEEIESLLNQSLYVQESVVFEEGANLVALVQLKPEILEKLYEELKEKAKDLSEEVKERKDALELRAKELLESVRRDVNSKLSAFSRLGKVVLHLEPFEKTPTQKIKRYIYSKIGGTEKKAD